MAGIGLDIEPDYLTFLPSLLYVLKQFFPLITTSQISTLLRLSIVLPVIVHFRPEEEIERQAGIQFDPKGVGGFLGNINDVIRRSYLRFR
jgi:hypothetical protein